MFEFLRQQRAAATAQNVGEGRIRGPGKSHGNQHLKSTLKEPQCGKKTSIFLAFEQGNTKINQVPFCRDEKDVPIYNFVPSEENILRWRDFKTYNMRNTFRVRKKLRTFCGEK